MFIFLVYAYHYGLFEDYEGHDFTICLKYRSCTGWYEIQAIGSVSASILLIKILDVKLRER